MSVLTKQTLNDLEDAYEVIDGVIEALAGHDRVLEQGQLFAIELILDKVIEALEDVPLDETIQGVFTEATDEDEDPEADEEG